MGTSSIASIFYTRMVTWAGMINKYVPEIRVTPMETGADVDNIRKMEKGEIQIGLGSDPICWESRLGLAVFDKAPLTKGRLAWLDCYATHAWWVLADSPIKTLSDLNGKVVNVGIPGSSTAEHADYCLKVLNLKPSKVERSATNEGIDSLVNGRIDCWVKGSTNPDSAILQVLATKKIRVVNFSNDEMSKFLAAYPYLGDYTLKAGTYQNVPEYRTYGYSVGAVISSDVPQALQYKVIKALYTNYKDFVTAFPETTQYGDILDQTFASKNVLAAGTVQYLKEKGYKVTKEQIPPEYKE